MSQDSAVRQRVEACLYVDDADALRRWSDSVRLGSDGQLFALNARLTPLCGGAGDVAAVLDDPNRGFLLENSGSCLPFDSAAVSSLKDERLRWLVVHCEFDGVGGWREFFAGCSSQFEAIIEATNPIYAMMFLGRESAWFYDWKSAIKLPAPVTSYGWRHYLTPRLVGDRRLGNGSIVDVGRFVDLPGGPFSTLEQRDWLEAMLRPILPAIHIDRSHRPLDDLDRLTAASVDGGIEMPEWAAG